jgi:hypothetical protein
MTPAFGIAPQLRPDHPDDEPGEGRMGFRAMSIDQAGKQRKPAVRL